MVDAWPDEVPHGIVEFEEVGGGSSGGAFGGLSPATDVSTGGPHWRATVSAVRLRTAAQINAARALEGILDGGAGAVLVPTCDRRLAPQNPAGPAMTAALGDNFEAGDSEITIALGAGALPLVGGEPFSADHPEPVGRRLYRVIEVVGGTDETPVVAISPALRHAALDGDALDFLSPSCPMRLESGFEIAVEMGRFADLEAAFTEWFAESPAILVEALSALSLSADTLLSASPEDTLVGRILGATAGSVLTLTDDAGGRFKLVDVDGVWKVFAGATATDFDVATGHDITVRETLAGRPNSPRDSILAVIVTAAPVPVLTTYINIVGTNLKAGTNTVTFSGMLPTDRFRVSKPRAAASGGLLNWDAYNTFSPSPPNNWQNALWIYGNNGGADTQLFALPNVNYATEDAAFNALAALLPEEFTGYTEYKVVGAADPIPGDNLYGLSLIVERLA